MTLDQILLVIVICAALIAAYFAPTIIALARKHRQTMAIGVLNVLAGWTLIGWIVALVWAFVSRGRDEDNYSS
jgi:sorbitol-specific phosphotransferase system component IIBC